MLLSPSVSGLQNMLDCCSEFAYTCTYNVKFNPSKSKCITFSQKKTIGSPELYMNDVKLDNVQLVKHLGHILTSDLSDDKDIGFCIRHPCITGRRMLCCQILNTLVVIYAYTLYNPTAAVFMDHSCGTYQIIVLTD